MSEVKDISVFVNRKKEIEDVTRMLLTGDVLVLGEAGIGKTALVNRIVDSSTSREAPKSAFIRINATSACYSGWLPERLTQKVYERIKSDEKLFSKIRKWFGEHGPELLKTIQAILDIYGKTTGRQVTAVGSFPTIADASKPTVPRDYEKAVLTLLDQYIKRVGKEAYIIIDDAHELTIVDKEFLTDLLANHSEHIHVLVARRTQEDESQLYSSPEVCYLMKASRIVRIQGLNRDAVELFLKTHKVSYDPKTLDEITRLIKGNPYFLSLLVAFAIRRKRALRGKVLETLIEQDIWSYLHSQFLMGFEKFTSILRASSILRSNIHAELLGRILGDKNHQRIQDQLLELEQRGIFCKDEIGGYRFFHPLLELYICTHLSAKDRLGMHEITASYYRELAEVSPTPLFLIATLYHAEKAGNESMQLWVLHKFAFIYREVGRLEESKKHAEKALELARKLKDEEREFESLILLFGLAPHASIDNIDERLLRLKQLITKEKVKTTANQINALWAEANYYVGFGDVASATRPLHKCYELMKQLNDDVNLLYLSHYEATLLLDLHQPEKARRILDRCLVGFEKLGNEKGVMVTLCDIGNLKCASDPDEAIELYQRCLEIARRKNDNTAIATALHGMGIASFELCKVNQAENHFKECLKITKRIGDTKGSISTYIELARVLISDGRLKDAAKFVQKAQIICEQTKYWSGLSHIKLVKGEIFEAEGKLKKAKQSFLSASELFSQLRDKEIAEYAVLRASEVGSSRLRKWARNVTSGRYEAKIGPDGLTDAERRLNPFVGKQVRVVVNQGKWNGASSSGTRVEYEGVLHKEKYPRRLCKLDRLMGHGKYDWWIEGRPVNGIESRAGNWLIQPFFAESIREKHHLSTESR